MTGWQIAFLVGVAVLVMLWADRVHTRRKQRALITETVNRRWYPTMQQIAKNTRGRWDLH